MPRFRAPFWIGIAFFIVGLLVILYGRIDSSGDGSNLEDSEALVKVFFSNSIQDPNSLDCDKTYASYRIADLSSNTNVEQVIQSQVSQELAQKIYYAVNGLLTGVTERESEEGFFSSINPMTRINRIIVENGVAYADFSSELSEGAAGACKVSAIRSQIENTLLQFPEITRVAISVNGDSKAILQP